VPIKFEKKETRSNSENESKYKIKPPSNGSLKDAYNEFYINKTEGRKQKFLDRFGAEYLTQEYTINGTKYNSLESILSNLDLSSLYTNLTYNKFHGDLQFDNILYNKENNKFTYIDWRESFGGNTDGGDVYYDLAKLYGGCIIPYNSMKDPSFVKLIEGSSVITYSYDIPKNLIKFKIEYEEWMINQGYDLNKVKLITAIIFLNMSPLHDDIFGKMLWFKSIELLTNVNK
jgi:thiamine kinase-like enzyme